MNALINPNIAFAGAGCFVSRGDWIHPSRVEETYELICVTDGTVHMADERIGEIHAERGEVLLLEPGVRHVGLSTSRGVRFYWVHFHLKGGELPFSRRVFPVFEESHLFRELLHLSCMPTREPCMTNAVLCHILSELCRLSSPFPPFHRKAEEIYEWLRIHADAALRAETAAERFGMSADHLSEILRKTYGIGYKKLCDRFLMENARGMLCHSELYIKEIAAALGFPSDKAFIGFFKYHEGLSPERFRACFAGIHMNNR